MYSFNGGAAVVRKGTAYALIDTNGNFIVPFNKYEFDINTCRISLPTRPAFF